MSKFIETVKKNRVVAIIFFAWVLCIITYATVRLFSAQSPQVTAGAATAYTALLALPSLAVGFWLKKEMDKNQ